MVEGELVLSEFAEVSPVRVQHHGKVLVVNGNVKLVMLGELVVERQNFFCTNSLFISSLKIINI